MAQIPIPKQKPPPPPSPMTVDKHVQPSSAPPALPDSEDALLHFSQLLIASMPGFDYRQTVLEVDERCARTVVPLYNSCKLMNWNCRAALANTKFYALLAYYCSMRNAPIGKQFVKRSAAFATLLSMMHMQLISADEKETAAIMLRCVSGQFNDDTVQLDINSLAEAVEAEYVYVTSPVAMYYRNKKLVIDFQALYI